MGGFHGGHSGGGGFHGGHSSGSHSSFRSYNSHTTVYVGNVETRTYNNVEQETIVYKGKTYKKPDYGTSNGKRMTFKGAVSLGGFLVALGLFLLMILLRVRTDAVITKTSLANDGDYYEVYDFEYKRNGKTYKGYGDDDAYYDYYTDTYRYSILEGEVYDIYVSPIIPSIYDFSSSANVGAAFCQIFTVAGVVIIVSSIYKRKKFLESLEELGDLNGDGKIDEGDFDYAKNHPYQEPKIQKKCPYCESVLDDDATECKSCGAKNL